MNRTVHRNDKYNERNMLGSSVKQSNMSYEYVVYTQNV